MEIKPLNFYKTISLRLKYFPFAGQKDQLLEKIYELW